MTTAAGFSATAAPQARRERMSLLSRPAAEGLSSLAMLAALGALWWLAAHRGWVSKVFLPTPEAAWQSLAEGLAGGELAGYAAATLARMVLGWGLAAALGVLLGALIGSSAAARAWLQPTLEFLRPLPASAVMPLAIAIFGLSGGMVLAVVAFGAMWPVLLATLHGLASVHPRLREVADGLQMGRLAFLWKIGLPQALPDRLPERRHVAHRHLIHRRTQGGQAGAAALRDLGQQLAQRLQPFKDLAHRRTLGPVLGKQHIDQRQQRRRHPGGPPGERHRLLELMPGHQIRHRVAGERRLAAEHLIEHAAQRVHVRAIVDLARPAALLGRHVARRAHDRAQLGPGVRLIPRGGKLGDAEIQELGPFPMRHVRIGHQHDVFGFQISMDDQRTISGKITAEKAHRGRARGKVLEAAPGAASRAALRRVASWEGAGVQCWPER